MTDPLSISAGIIAILKLTGTVVQYLNDVARASEERRRILDEITTISGILTLLKDLAERPQWGDSWSTTMNSLNVPNGPLEQFRSALERLASKLDPVRGLKRSLAWPFQKGEVNDILRAMERQKTLFNLALQNDHTRLSQAIRLDIEGLNDRVGEVSQKIAQVQIGQTNQERRHQDEETQKVLSWLSPLNFFAQQSDIIERRQDGTGLWLLESEEFKKWFYGTRQTLFCPGIPGAGKTVLASIVIQQLSSNMRDGNIGLAYVFCNYRSQLEQTPVNIFASFLRQLIPEGASAPGNLKSLYQSHIRKGTRPALDEVSKLLLSQMESYSQIFIVVDALDECPDGNGIRELMLAKLRLLQASKGVNLMVTSRPIPKIMEAFEYDPQLEIRASEADVRRYLDGQMSRLARCVIKNTTLQEDIKGEIAKAVDGMYVISFKTLLCFI
jgi:NACHT domain